MVTDTLKTLTIAREQGNRFYQGKPCPYGHTGSRYVSTASCKDCTKERYSKDPLHRRTVAYAGSKVFKKRFLIEDKKEDTKHDYWEDLEKELING